MMNRSGQAVQQAAAFYKIPPERVLVIFDDISLPVGKLRVRPRRQRRRPQRGQEISFACLGSDGFPRVKIGVGEEPNPDYDLAAWVLGPSYGGGMENAGRNEPARLGCCRMRDF